MTKYISSYDRLVNLPPIFSLNAFVRATALSRTSARVVLKRWVEKGFVEPAGPRAAIYFNRIIDPNGDKSNAVIALAMKYPSATLCGASVLHSAGWTTQIPSTLHAAVESRASFSQIDGVTLHPKSIAWFRQMQDHGAWQGKEDDDFATFGLRSLSPSWALADLYADPSQSTWKPDEDDLDIPDENNLGDAFSILGKTPEWFVDHKAFERPKM